MTHISFCLQQQHACVQQQACVIEPPLPPLLPLIVLALDTELTLLTWVELLWMIVWLLGMPPLEKRQLKGKQLVF